MPGCLHDSDCPPYVQLVREENNLKTYYRCEEGVCISRRIDKKNTCR
jgi:hypothetical protein